MHLSSVRVGAGVPAINVAETKNTIEMTIERVCVDENDINFGLDGNRVVCLSR